MKKIIVVISTHVIVQILIYSILSYFHLWGFLFTRIQPKGPSVIELMYMHSTSVFVNLFIAAIFMSFWRNTWRLNVICVIINFMFILIYSVFIWMIYQS